MTEDKSRILPGIILEYAGATVAENKTSDRMVPTSDRKVSSENTPLVSSAEAALGTLRHERNEVLEKVVQGVLVVLREASTYWPVTPEEISNSLLLQFPEAAFMNEALDLLRKAGLAQRVRAHQAKDGRAGWVVVPTEIYRARARGRAAVAVHHALVRGDLVQQRCVRCTSQLSEAHHVDAEKPLEVTWLCVTCARTQPLERVWHDDPFELCGLRQRTKKQRLWQSPSP